MNFSSSVFIYLFMPTFLLAYPLSCWVTSKCTKLRTGRLPDVVIVAFGMLFYAWACFDNIFFLLLIIFFSFLAGSAIEKLRVVSMREIIDSFKARVGSLKLGKMLCILIVVGVLLILYKYKYLGEVSLLKFHVIPIVTPLGISFLTFSIISYLVDVYKGSPHGDLVDVALYISFFPKVISGPIVTWSHWKKGGVARDRHVTVDNAYGGIERIIIGLAKKIVIADYFGTVISTIDVSKIDWQSAWLVSILYTFQIYYDFSGYSDIAIGLAKYIGIDIEENFDFPYISTSISEFWRRWHISLGNWLKEYIYIPLGGSRRGYYRTLINLFIVMLVSGIWHGAGYGYIMWGCMHGACIVIERVIRDKNWYKKIPGAAKWIFTMLVVMLGWQIFRTNSLSGTIIHIARMFNVGTAKDLTFTYEYYITTKLIAILAVAVAGSTVFFKIRPLFEKYVISESKAFLICKMVILLGLFAVTLVCLTNSTYSPFIYFQY